MIDPGGVGLLLLLGTWAALDGTSVAQVMVSRPLVAGTLAGWILGEPETGLAVGAILETAHLADLPAGAARILEPGPAAVPGAAAAVLLGGTGGWAVGAALGVFWAFVGGATMVWLRRLNGALVAPLTDPAATTRTLILRHWACIGADAARGVLLTGAGLVLAALLPASLADSWGPGDGWSLALLLLPGALGFGILLRRWSGGASALRRTLVLAGGVAVGATLGLAL